ncbi:MAG: UPF0280 family protein [Desulfobacterales bacterium]
MKHLSHDVYRSRVGKKRFHSFRVRVRETDILVHAKTDLRGEALESVLKCRGFIESYCRRFPGFAESLLPWEPPVPHHGVISEMIRASKSAGVGPMATVAGAVAECVGRDLLHRSDEIIVENGGDVFCQTRDPVTVGIYAGNSPLSLNIGVKVHSLTGPVSVCTSSGTVGHSLSLGKADAVCIRSGSCALADAAATSLGNIVKGKPDIQTAIETGKKIEGVQGVLVIVGDAVGAWGDMELVPLNGKNP